MANKTPVDPHALREEVRSKYRQVATDPNRDYHFHTGRALARKLGYRDEICNAMPDIAIESFAGVGNPFSLRSPGAGEHIVDPGSGGGFDCFVAASCVGPRGRVVGVDMTPEMLEKSRRAADEMELAQVEFRKGLIEALPVDDEWADAVISNGVINLCADKKQVFEEIWRVLRPGGWLQFADIANGAPVPAAAVNNIDLWTA